MKNLSYTFFEKIYKYFYFYCISGRDEERERLIRQQDAIRGVDDNILLYLFHIMRTADAMDRGGNRKDFLRKSEECGSLEKDDFDTWCYHQILLLSYTYIYPDAEKAREHKKQCEVFLRQLASEERARVEKLCNDFNRQDYEIQKHLAQAPTMKDAYKARFAERDFRLGARSFLMILKGFSSSTPFFYPALEKRFYPSAIKGGGIFLKWNGYGVAIDPGINFMENMHKNGLEIKDINAVIVTHDHIDHNGDLQVIDDLAYSFEHRIELYVDQNTLLKAEKLTYLRDKHMLDSKITKEFYIGNNKDIRVDFIETRHIFKDQAAGTFMENASFALKVNLYEDSVVKRRIGITSDTTFFPELISFMSDCDYVIANMSEPDKLDYEKKKDKENHLGYWGCLKLIRDCNQGKEEPTLPRYIISEFWAGKGDARRELVKRLREESGYEKVYPGDIGMMFFLDRPGFLCDYCGCETDMDDLHVIRDKNEYGQLSLVCDNCILI